MAGPSPEAQCGFCGKTVKRRNGNRGGRPREYCDRVCRDRAQRQRDRQRSVSTPSFHIRQTLSRDLAAHANRLLTAGTDVPLHEVLHLTGRLRLDAECLAATAVDAARLQGYGWAEVAAATGLTEASARARWGGAAVERLLSRRIPAQRTRRTAPGTIELGNPLEPAIHHLGAALHTLHKTSRTPLGHISALTGLPLSTITSLIEGRTTATWPETYMLCHALGGEPQDLHLLWQIAQGTSQPITAENSRGLLTAALRGAHLAAGLPATSTDRGPHPHTAPTDPVPAWPDLEETLTRLGADPRPFTNLWAAAHAAQHTIAEGEHGP